MSTHDPMTDPVAFDLTPRGAWSILHGAKDYEAADGIALAIIAQELRVANLFTLLGSDLVDDEMRASTRKEIGRLLRLK